jgi:hypothetical protein
VCIKSELKLLLHSTYFQNHFSTNGAGAESKGNTKLNTRLLFGPIPSVRCCIFSTDFRTDPSFGHPHDKTDSREVFDVETEK